MSGNISKSINIAINVINGVSKQVGTIAKSFDKLSKGADASAKSISSLNKMLANFKVPTGTKSLTKDLTSLSKVNGSGIDKIVKGLSKFESIKFPSFSAVNSDLTKHISIIKKAVTAYSDLSRASKSVNLKGLSSSAKTGNKAVSSLNKTTQKSKTSFSQWGFALGSASTGLSKFGTQIYGVTRGFSAVSKEMGLALGAFTAVFSAMFAIKGVVTDLVEFDDALRAAGAVAGASSVELSMFADAARDMGESTRYTATQAAEALKALAMTGLTVTDAIATLPTVLNLAAAANMDLGQSADIVTNIMVGYGKSVEDLPHIADLMTAAFTSSNTSLQELGTAMKYVGPVANAAGQSIEETTGILASLANAGYRGSKAGTTLRTSIARLLAPTKKASEALAHYGIAATDLTESNGNLKSFTDILGLMSKAGIGAGDALTIFGKRAGPGMLALLSQGMPAIREMNAAIAEQEGIALKVAYEMEAGLGGALRKLISMWKEVSITIGKVIEQDVQDFIERLTKTLKDNKQEIADVVHALFRFIGVMAKVVGWVTSFLASNLKMVAGIGILALALKGLAAQSTAVAGSNLAAGLSGIASSVKWIPLAAGIKKVTMALTAYTTSVKAAGVMSVGSGIGAFLGTFTKSGIVAGISAIGTQLLALASAAGAAVTALIAANPVIAAIIGIAAGAAAVLMLMDTNYAGMAQSASDAAKASLDLNRAIEYQTAKLNLINKEYEKDSINGHMSAQQELVDVLMLANISLDDKIRLIKLARTGDEGAKKAIDELNISLDANKKANDAKALTEAANARTLNAQAIRKEALESQRLYGVTLDDGQKSMTIMENMIYGPGGFKNILTIWGLWDRTFGEGMAGHQKAYEDLMASQAKYGGNFTKMVESMANSKASVDDFVAAMEQSGASSENIAKAKDLFIELRDATKEATEASGENLNATKAQIDAAEVVAAQILENAKTAGTEREAVLSQTLYNLAVMEATGVASHEQVEMAKLQATISAAEESVKIAKETADTIAKNAGASREGKEAALAAVVAAEKAAADIRLQMLNKIAADGEVINKKIIASNTKKNKEIQRSETKTDDLKSKLDTKQENAEIAKNSKIEEANITLKDKLAEIDKSIADKRKDFADQRLALEKSTANNIASINSSAADKIRAIRQKGMTDYQKNADNRKTADSKLSEGLALVEKARQTGDKATLDRGKGLISQSQDLFSGLDDQAKAIDGVKKSAVALGKAEEAASAIALQNIEKESKAEEQAATDKKKNAEDDFSDTERKAEKTYAIKLAAAEKFYDEEMKKEDTNHKTKMGYIDDEINKYSDKLSVIEAQRDLVAEVIEKHEALGKVESESKIWEKAAIGAQAALDAVDDYAGAIEELDDKEANIKFTGEASPKAPLGEKLEDLAGKLQDLGAEINVNVIFAGEKGKSLTADLEAKKAEIESVDITLPVNMNPEQIEAAIVLINEMKKADINVIVNVEKAKLNEAVAILKDIKSKIVNITLKVAGLDNLVKAKKLIDSIKSKTVTITTIHKSKGGSVSSHADGGEVGQYADGGTVFKKLASRYINKGGGKKDDVPAMLMKGEFVQKVSAVQKYGKKFMARLNAGLIPKGVTQGFNAGGSVEPEHYAKGGRVGYSNSEIAALRKKKIFEIFQNKVSAVSDKVVNSKALGITTEIGTSSLQKMANTISSAVGGFADGGSGDAYAAFAKSKQTINDDYFTQMTAASKDGNDELVSILAAEQKALAVLAKELSDELAGLKEEYDAYVAEASEEHMLQGKERDQTYNDDVSALNVDHTQATKDIDDDYNAYVLSETDDYNKNKKDREIEYGEENREMEVDHNGALQDISDDYKSDQKDHNDDKEAIAKEHEESTNEEYEKIVAAKVAALQQASVLYDFGKFIQEEGLSAERRTFRKMGGAQAYREEMLRDLGIESWPNKYKYNLAVKTAFRNAGKTSIGYGDESYTEASALGKIEEIWAGYESAINVLRDFGIGKPELATQPSKSSDLKGIVAAILGVKKKEKMDASDTEFMDVTAAMNLDKKNENDDYQENKRVADFEYNTENDSIKFDFDKALSDAVAEKAKSKSEEDASYNISSSDLKKSYTNETSSANVAHTKALKDASEQYNKDIADATTANEESKSETKISYAETSQEAQKNLRDILEELRKEKFAKTTALTRPDVVAVPGFNSGGFIGNSPGSIKGKDSILAAVAPEEYVVRADVVRKFGKGFFDSINNFKIPKFNTGGIVGSVKSLASGSATQAIKHTLDLSINGSSQGELTGSQSTISNILNDLTLAKLRS